MKHRVTLAVVLAWSLGSCGGSGDGNLTDVGPWDAPNLDARDQSDVSEDAEVYDAPDVFDVADDHDGVPVETVDAVDEETPPEPARWVEIGLGFPDDYVFKGLWGASSQDVVVVGAGPRAYRFDGSVFSDISPSFDPPILNSVWGSGPGDLWMVGMGGATLHYQNGWGGAKCATDDDCGSADPCAVAKCESAECVLVPAPVPGCCGFPSLETGFDGSGEGSLDGFEVVDSYEGVADKGGIVWNVFSHEDALSGQPRYTSPSYSLHFGRSDVPCTFDPGLICPDFDNGKIVGASATSPAVVIPNAKSATLTFEVFIDSESSSSYDKLSVQVVKGAGAAVTVWEKAEVGGTTGGVFKQAVVDLTEFVGQTIRIRFLFDSVDSMINQGEGVYIDDVRLTTECGEVVQPTSFPTLFGVSGTGPDNVFAVGADGAIIHFDGKTWKPMGVWGLTAFYGVCDDPDTGLWAVGSGGTVVRMNQGVFEQVPSGVTNDLHACERGMLAVGAGGVAVQGSGSGVISLGAVAFPDLEGVSSLSDGHAWAVGADGTVVEFVDGKSSTFVVGDGVDLHAVYAAGPKTVWAVGEGGTVVRFNGKVWVSSKTGADQPLFGVHGTSSGRVTAVGAAGIEATRQDGEWVVGNTQAGSDLFAIRYTSEDEAWIVGANGVIVHLEGDVYTPLEDSPTDRHLYALAQTSEGRLYASGLGVILALDDGKWRNVFTTTDVDLRGVFALDGEHVYAAGKAGTIIRY
ncbi:MAG: hypothetical protein GXP54_10880, partial [Deltaproteobacteria bacterium]|nr:hypothetical protein [Deltaproteobacteria bacterium]